ncbi:MAG TPA: DMT family transporter [Ktedonobacterales bacterium]
MQSSKQAVSQRRIGAGLIILSAVGFGTLGIFARLSYADGADPLTVLTLRFALAAPIMLVLMALQRASIPRGGTLLGLVLMGGIGYVAQSFSYFTAVSLASPGLVALILYTYPAMVTVLAAVFLHERLTALTILVVVLALTGTALTLGPAIATAQSQPLGLVFALAGAIIYAVYILVGSRITPRAGALSSSTVIILSAAVVLGSVVAWRGPTFPTSSTGWIAVAAIALISTVLPIVAFFAGLARVGATAAATFSTLEPVVTVVLAALVLAQPLTPIQLVGGMLILVAAVVLAVARGRQRTPASGTVSS